MKINSNININGEYVKRDIYRMTKNNTIKKMSEIEDGTMIVVTGFIQYSDEKSDGSTMDVLSIETETGEIFATNSSTFINAFDDIYDMMQELPLEIIVVHGKSKAGRNYITCDLA